MKRTIYLTILTVMIINFSIIIFTTQFVRSSFDPLISGAVLDRHGNPIPNIEVVCWNYSMGIRVSSITDYSGEFAFYVPQGVYSIGLTPLHPGENLNLPTWFTLGAHSIFISQDTFISFFLKNIYLTGKVIDPNGGPVPGVTIYIPAACTSFDSLSGAFDALTTSDADGNFNLALFPSTCGCHSLFAIPPVESPYDQLILSLEIIQDSSIILCLPLKTPTLPPVASFSYKPSNPKVGEKVSFDASASYDPDGQIVSFEWSFGDGFIGEGMTVTHTYSKEGNYKATITVIDNDGKSCSASKTLTVVKPKADERIEKAIAWALDWADGPPYPEGSYKPEYRNVCYKGYCLAFVQDAYQYGAKASVTRYGTAKEAWQKLSPLKKGAPPRGAYVFYDVTSGPYAEYDHVGLSLGDGKVVHAHHTYGPVIDNNYEKLTRGYSGLKYIGWAWPPLTPPLKTSGLTALATCPVDLVITDPDHLMVSKEYNEIPGAIYTEEDINGDGSPDDYIFIPERKIGQYLINVIPEPTADPTAIYTLEVSSEGITFLLAENVSINDIPAEPFIIDSATFETPPFTSIINAMIDFEPDTLNLGSQGEWITAYIELPEGYNIADINISTILLNGTIPIDVNAPIAIDDYDNDSIPDLMVKINRAEVISYIFDNIDIAELYEKRFMIVTLTVIGKLNNGTTFQGSCTIEVILPVPSYSKMGQYL